MRHEWLRCLQSYEIYFTSIKGVLCWILLCVDSSCLKQPPDCLETATSSFLMPKRWFIFFVVYQNLDYRIVGMNHLLERGSVHPKQKCEKILHTISKLKLTIDLSTQNNFSHHTNASFMNRHLSTPLHNAMEKILSDSSSKTYKSCGLLRALCGFKRKTKKDQTTRDISPLISCSYLFFANWHFLATYTICSVFFVWINSTLYSTAAPKYRTEFLRPVQKDARYPFLKCTVT